MKSNPLVLDIETLPLAAALNEPYPKDQRTPPANYKNPEAIAGWYERDELDWREKRVKQCSINPRLGRVLCIGMLTDDRTDAAVNFAKSEPDEAKLLRTFWEVMGVEAGEVVTWNGTWDLQFLCIRSMVHKITPTIRQDQINGWFRRYSVYPHFDCRAVLTRWSWGEEGEGLAEWAKTFGLPERPETIRGLGGGDVSRLYAEGKLTTIEEYCAWDVKDTTGIYERLAPMYDAHYSTLRLSA